MIIFKILNKFSSPKVLKATIISLFIEQQVMNAIFFLQIYNSAIYK